MKFITPIHNSNFGCYPLKINEETIPKRSHNIFIFWGYFVAFPGYFFEFGDKEHVIQGPTPGLSQHAYIQIIIDTSFNMRSTGKIGSISSRVFKVHYLSAWTYWVIHNYSGFHVNLRWQNSIIFEGAIAVTYLSKHGRLEHGGKPWTSDRK